jgi:hypothetical protein
MEAPDDAVDIGMADEEFAETLAVLAVAHQKERRGLIVMGLVVAAITTAMIAFGTTRPDRSWMIWSALGTVALLGWHEYRYFSQYTPTSPIADALIGRNGAPRITGVSTRSSSEGATHYLDFEDGTVRFMNDGALRDRVLRARFDEAGEPRRPTRRSAVATSAAVTGVVTKAAAL